jgi:hypothetical protein
LGQPNDRANLILLCTKCHGDKTELEKKLTEKLNIVGYVLGLRGLGFPVDRLKAAFHHYGLTIERIV